MVLHEAREAQHAAEVAQLNARVASSSTAAGAGATGLNDAENSAIRAEYEEKLQFGLDRGRAEATLAVERARMEAMKTTESLQRINADHGTSQRSSVVGSGDRSAKRARFSAYA